MLTNVTFFLNGDYDTHGIPIDITDVTTMTELFAKATKAFNLEQVTEISLNRVFLSSGVEITDPSTITAGTPLYFSSGEDFVTKEQRAAQDAQNGAGADGDAPQGQQEPTYLYSAAMFTAGMVSAGYGLWSNAVRAHAPQSVVNVHNNMEQTVATYAKPLIEASLPYVSSTVVWSDKQLNHAIEVTTEKTHQFLETDAGKKLSQGVENVKEFSSHAVESFKHTMQGNNNTTGSGQSGNGEGQQQTEEQQQQNYVNNLKERLGSTWSDSLLPLVNSTYDNLKTQVEQYVPQNNNPDEPQQEEKKE